MKKRRKIKGYKAFNKDMTCQGFQFQEGKTYKTDKAEICQEGFHFCTNPFDVLDYYNLCDSEFHEIQSTGIIDQDNQNSKKCTTEIKIEIKLNIKGFINACVDFLIKKSNPNIKIESSGDYAQIESSGVSAKIGSSGDYAQIESSGVSAQIGSSGDSAKIGSSGGSAKIESSGDYAKIESSGDYAQIESSGDYAQIGSSGVSAKMEINGKNSVGSNIGIKGRAKGKKGNWITLAEYTIKNHEHVPVCVKSKKIDGKNIKENTWYQLQNKKFVEVK